MTDFNDTWAPTWEVQKTLPTARSCIIENTDRKFKTGRPVVDAVFFDSNRREICRRSGMRLTSKKGNEYVVCRREPELTSTSTSAATDDQIGRTAIADAQHDVGEIFSDL